MGDNMTIYALKQYCDSKSLRGDTIGIFSKEEDALNIVKNNTCDLCENGYYPYIVVFPVEEGLYYLIDSNLEKWFQWNREKNCYVPIERPEFMEGWAMIL